MKYLYGLILTAFVLLWSSCRNDFDAVPSTGNLEFSRDTVYLDTVFTNIGSSTYTLKVYNRSNDDINIPSVRLGQGENSNYRLNVDGLPGKVFQDVQILAKDSIFIFIETTVDVTNQNNNLQYLYTDQILFDSGGNQQKVELVTLVQDAVFLYPERFPDGTTETIDLGTAEDPFPVYGFFLDDTELTFTNDKPYVIYGLAAVPPNKTLTVEPGARVHFHADSGLLVANSASIKSNGAPSADPDLMENEIIFEGDRLEPTFSEVPGQWLTIWCTAGSTDNEFSYTTIKNSTVGILMDSNDGNRTLTLKNVQIYNSANVGLLARTGDVYGENVVITNSGQTSLSCSLGGRYVFNHCTFANYWNNSFRSFPSVIIDNELQTGENEITVADLVEATFNNCIIYGSEQREIALIQNENAAFNFQFNHSLIRFEDPFGDFEGNPNYDFNDVNHYTNCVINEDPVFQDPTANNLNIETGTSAADGLGETSIANLVPIDLNGVPRGGSPDSGAFESIQFPVED